MKKSSVIMNREIQHLLPGAKFFPDHFDSEPESNGDSRKTWADLPDEEGLGEIPAGWTKVSYGHVDPVFFVGNSLSGFLQFLAQCPSSPQRRHLSVACGVRFFYVQSCL
jgi:hypothetical protein